MGYEKDSKKRILASLVMGLNCVNSFAPMAVAVNAQPENVPAKPVKETVAEPEQYTAACYQALDVVDSVVFGKAEAAFTKNVTAGNVSGETIEVSALGTTGNYSVQTVNGGILSKCIVQSGGTQNLSGGSVYYINISNGGVQNVSGGNVGNIGIFSGGVQNVRGCNELYLVTISNGGVQNLSGGTVTFNTVHSGGVQNVSDGL